MKILGINQVAHILSWQHDGAAALVIDGKIVASAEEERFNRIRHARGFPTLAVEYCLREGGIKLTDVDIIAVGHNPYAFLKRLRIPLHPALLARHIGDIFIFHMKLRQFARKAGARIMYIDHHMAHAASTYHCSGYDEANVLTIDGSGETETFAFFKGVAGKLTRIWDIPLAAPTTFSMKNNRSVGMVYTRVTDLLHLGVLAEGKTMGLASYGTAKYDFSKILDIRDHKHYKLDKSALAQYRHLRRTSYDEPLTQEHKDLAASLQHALEVSVVNLAREAYGHTGFKHFALAGGVALNCNTNTKILEQDFCDGIFIQPAANDGGIALGAALGAAEKLGEPIPCKRIQDVYFGPQYGNEKIESLLREVGIEYKKCPTIEVDVAKLIADGKMVGWFQGRMELGPRALGNRSILANPTVKGMDERVNVHAKHRETWRPFAPSVTEEAAAKYFEGVDRVRASPFMLHTFYVREQYRNLLPAITHVDGSSRIQTVNREQNERYYTLLKEVEKRTGHPVVLNTSFNDKGEPIVCTPRDALRCFFSTGIDALAMGDFLLIKSGNY